METFTTFDIERILNIKRLRLQEWIEKGFIKPDTPAAGKGTKALFTREQLYHLKMATWLISSGLPRSRAFDDSNLDFNDLKGQGKFNVIRHDYIPGRPEVKIGGSKTDSYPTSMGPKTAVQIVISIDAVIDEVDAAI